MLYRSIYIGNPAHLKLKDKQLKITNLTTQTISCYQSQNYKIWKQFTTLQICSILISRLLSITKLQNLKAIHNEAGTTLQVVDVVINRKTTKFESNSQQVSIGIVAGSSCYQSQNYKIWKQFTTVPSLLPKRAWMLSITKLQNLKAIRNRKPINDSGHLDVINHKTTKFESNLQRIWLALAAIIGCYQSQNYKIWKQFTTALRLQLDTAELLSIAKL